MPLKSFARAVNDIVSPLYSTFLSSTTVAVIVSSFTYVIVAPMGMLHFVNEKLDALSVTSVSISCAVASA